MAACRLVREISTGNHCRQGQGRGWWFDHGGIWVDRGCRGVFEFGRGRRGPPNSNAAIAAGLVILGNGGTTLRDERGRVINSGLLRDGMVFWNNGQRSWIALEDPGVMLGDVEAGTHFNFRRS